jgi:hypothetical protein
MFVIRERLYAHPVYIYIYVCVGIIFKCCWSDVGGFVVWCAVVCSFMYVAQKNDSYGTSFYNQNVPIKLKFLPHRLQRKKMVTDVNFGFVVLFLM